MRSSSGFTLIEVLVAAALIMTAASGTAQLIVWSVRQTSNARRTLEMSLAASETLSRLAAAASTGPLAASPADSLDRDEPGCFDTASPVAYRRRWLVISLYGGRAVAIAVRVLPIATGGPAAVQVTTVRQVGP